MTDPNHAPQTWSTLFLLLACLIAATFISLALGQEVLFDFGNKDLGDGSQATVLERLIDRLQILAIVALLIERAIETYLRASGIATEEVIDPATGITYRVRPVPKVTALAAVVFATPVAMMGLGVLDPMLPSMAAGCTDNASGASEQCHTGTAVLLWLVNIALTVGLLAGGAELIHQVIKLLPLSTDRLGQAISGRRAPAAGNPGTILLRSPGELRALQLSFARESGARIVATQFQITVERTEGNVGTVIFNDGAKAMTAACRWDPATRIAAGTYPNCSRSTIIGKNRDGIYIPGAMLNGKPQAHVFIHNGAGETRADGCIILADEDMAVLLAAIPDTDAMNITVTIRDP